MTGSANDSAPTEPQAAGVQPDAPATAPARIAPKSARAAIEPEKAPRPPRRSKKARHPWIIGTSVFLSVLLLVMVGLAGAYYYGKTLFVAAGPLPADKVLVIPAGSGAAVIASALKREGVIDDERMFSAAAIVYRPGRQLRAGEYLFPQAASMREVVDILIEGKAILHSVTLPEGLTSHQIVQRLQEQSFLVGDIRTIPPEGALMPNTYKVQRGTTRESLIQRMAQERQRVVADVWRRKGPDSPIKTPEDMVILASIVEKETGKADERPRVAAVFINRLKRKMRLQSDPTIIYGIVGGVGSLGRGLTRAEIDRPTPYNTYQIDGLPPTPIANPGKDALEAVANPSRTADLYFVADGTGGHVFAQTYEEHLRNVAQWREIERQRSGKQ